MSHQEHNPEPIDLVDRATAALRNMDVPDGPDERLMADTLSALRAASEFSKPAANKGSGWRIFTMKTTMKLAVAACAALVIGAALLLFTSTSSSLAFGDVLEQVKQVRSVRFTSVVTQTVPEGVPNLPPGPRTQEVKMMIVGDRMRQEMQGGVTIMDMKQGEMLTLQPAMKQAMHMKMQNVPEEVRKQNLLEQFRKFEGRQGKPLGAKEVAGREAEGFEVVDGPMIFTVWADRRTHLPLEVETVVEGTLLPRSQMVMRDFEWDVPVDESLMSLEPPAGYEVQTMQFDMSPAKEQDLIESLRRLAIWNDGQFPDEFGMAGLSQAIMKLDRSLLKELAKERQGELATEMMTISRGMIFVEPSNGDEWHYAGKDVKLGEPNRPIFWYRPTGSQQYRAIGADLMVRDLNEEQLPEIEAKRLSPGLLTPPAGGDPPN